MKTIHRPPGFFLRFFRWFCRPELRDTIEGDLVELYNERVPRAGKNKSNVLFVADVLLLLRPGIIRSVNINQPLIHYGMFKSYFILAWRNLMKGKAYSLINVSGLCIGMTVAILIGLWMWDELTFNSYFQHHKRLAQVMLNQTNEGITYTGGTISPAIADPLRTKYSGDFKALSLVSWNSDHVIGTADKKIYSRGRWVEAPFPSMFTLNMIQGRPDGLRDPSTIFISQSLATALFGSADPMNKSVRLDNHLDLIVGGVYEDLPTNTAFNDTQMLLPWSNTGNWMNTVADWDNHMCQLYAQLSDHADLPALSERIRSLPTPHITAWKEEIMLQPLDRIHLYSEFENGQEAGGRIDFVWLFGIIGAFVLLLACINFMNLSTARSEKRSREVGIRKTVGSVRAQLVKQFLIESLVVAVTALAFALVFTQLALPFFNTMAGKKIIIPWTLPGFWMLVLGFTLFAGVISGSYPAFYLSSFKPIRVLKGTFRAGRLATVPRKVLVVVQFTVSITLIIGTLVVFRQIEFAKDRTAGFARSGLITLYANSEVEAHYDAIRNDLLQQRAVAGMARSSQSPAHFSNNTTIDWPGKDPGLVIFFRNVTISPDFGKTIGWTMREGRDFSRTLASDSGAVIVNETAAKIIGLPDPIGERVGYDKKEYTIIGVANDMITQSPYEPVEPCIFFLQGWAGVVTLRLNPGLPVDESIAQVRAVFKKHNPGTPFDYQFVDEEYGRKFANEEKIGSLASLFAVLAIFISCLGLFGLASFVAEQRTKEIGIRKVLGASVASLWKMLSKDFVLLIVIAFAIAIPLSFYSMAAWLEHFAYRTTLAWYIFAVAGAGAVALTLATISFQAIKAAVASPINSLRSE